MFLMVIFIFNSLLSSRLNSNTYFNTNCNIIITAIHLVVIIIFNLIKTTFTTQPNGILNSSFMKYTN